MYILTAVHISLPYSHRQYAYLMPNTKLIGITWAPWWALTMARTPWQPTIYELTVYSAYVHGNLT